MSTSHHINMASKKMYAILPGTWRTAQEKLADGIWPWVEGVRGRLPLHYKLRIIDNHMTTPRPVHYRPDERKYTVDKYGQRMRVQNVPIPITYPREADEGLWGGVGIITGFKKKKDNPLKPRYYKMWKPQLTKRVFYSEILDKYMEITVTLKTLEMIDEAHGFDNYILKTHEVDLHSKLGNRLKREMLLALCNKSFHNDNLVKQEEVYEKYKALIIPEEEAEWVGLSLKEAEEKQLFLEEQQKKKETIPLKNIYLDDLLEKLKIGELDVKQESWLQKLSPFKQDKDKEY